MLLLCLPHGSNFRDTKTKLPNQYMILVLYCSGLRGGSHPQLDDGPFEEIIRLLSN